ncbi:MAG: flagellar basal body-associated FliL family protein [Chromatiales bacterium]|jgi:flagellar FliL protein
MRAFLLLILFGMSILPALAQEPGAAEETEEAEEEEEIVYETAYFAFVPAFVSNMQGKAKYIRTNIQIMTNRAEFLDEIKMHAPALRHEVLMVLAEKNGEDIMDNDGKEALRQELLAALGKALDEKVETKGLITDLFFTSYYVK